MVFSMINFNGVLVHGIIYIYIIICIYIYINNIYFINYHVNIIYIYTYIYIYIHIYIYIYDNIYIYKYISSHIITISSASSGIFVARDPPPSDGARLGHRLTFHFRAGEQPVCWWQKELGERLGFWGRTYYVYIYICMYIYICIYIYIYTRWCPSSLAQLVNISPSSRLGWLGGYIIYSIHGDYRITYNWGGAPFMCIYIYMYMVVSWNRGTPSHHLF